MRDQIHQFLKWSPAAVVGAGGFAATISASAAMWLSDLFVSLWGAMHSPFVTVIITLGVGVYVAAIMMTAHPKSTTVGSNNPATDFKLEHRRKVIADGRKLIAEFNLQARARTLMEFMQSREEWPAIRAHLGIKVRKDIENGRLLVATGDSSLKDGKVYYLMDELDRLEQEWDLA